MSKNRILLFLPVRFSRKRRADVRFSKKSRLRAWRGGLCDTQSSLVAIGFRWQTYSLLNDTVATLLQSWAIKIGVFDSFIGFILGTEPTAPTRNTTRDQKKRGLDPPAAQVITPNRRHGSGLSRHMDVRFDKPPSSGCECVEKMFPVPIWVLYVFVLRSLSDGLFSKPCSINSCRFDRGYEYVFAVSYGGPAG